MILYFDFIKVSNDYLKPAYNVAGKSYYYINLLTRDKLLNEPTQTTFMLS